jgi:hypothetical protein
MIKKIIKESTKIGIKVRAVVSDMGSTNQAVWRHFGVHSYEGGNVKFKVRSVVVEYSADIEYPRNILRSRALLDIIPANLITVLDMK